MRIISKFTDYYDHAAGYGIDNTLNYIRKSKKTTVEEFPDEVRRLVSMASLPNFKPGIFTARCSVIGFCGKYYPMLNIIESAHHSRGGWVEEKTINLYDCESIGEYLKRPDLKKIHESWNKKHTSKELNNDWYYRPFNYQIWDKVFNVKIESDDEFHKQGSPIMLYTFSTKRSYNERKIQIINPNLSDYEFYKVVDPYTAFQEVSMYLGGVLGANENPMVQISDEDMRDAKGHDNMSFKTPPTKKR